MEARNLTPVTCEFDGRTLDLNWSQVARMRCSCDQLLHIHESLKIREAGIQAESYFSRTLHMKWPNNLST